MKVNICGGWKPVLLMQQKWGKASL